MFLATRPPRWPLIVIVLFLWTLTTRGKQTVSGDEPHYLMIAESLLVDRDLDLQNNYDQNDGRRFGADGMTPGLHARPARNGQLWSVHDIGLPVLLLPVYALATRAAAYAPPDVLARFRQTPGLFGFTLVSSTLVVLTTCAAALLLSGIWRVAPRYAATVVLVLVLSPPVLSHAFLVFPETVAFAVICAVVWIICLRADEIRLSRMVMIVGAVGLLPWLHRKYSFFVFGLGVLIFFRHRGWIGRQLPRVLWLLAGLVILPQAALHVWTLHAWGNLGGPQMLDWLPFSTTGLETGGFGMIFDRERGLLGYAPIYLLVPACWALDWPRSRLLLVPVLLLLVPLAAFVTWHGGFSPAARFLVPVTPLLILPAVFALEHAAIRWSSIPIVILQVAIIGLAWSHPRDLWPRELGTNRILEKIPGIGVVYEHWLPSIATGDSPARAWLCLGTLVGLTVAVVIASRLGATRAAVSR
jgi:hypothetical protein